jgi:hypothetical protein
MGSNINRDPRYADAERIIGALTMCPGASVLITLIAGWQSGLLHYLETEWVRDGWVIGFLLFGFLTMFASHLWDIRIRITLLHICAAGWIAIGAASVALQLPISLAVAVVVIGSCVFSVRRLRYGSR